MTDHLVIGADIGGTHITAAIVDLEKKNVLPGSLTRMQVDSHAPYGEIIEIWSQAIIKARDKHNIGKVSLAIPGPFEYENGICLIKDQDKYKNLYGLNIKELLSLKLGNKPADIVMVNDAESFLLGEVFSGAARGFNTVIGITLGTGLGSCTYKGDISFDAGMWNMPFKAGIAEDYLSTRWFITKYQEITGKKIGGVRELSGLADFNSDIRLIFEEFGNNLADFLIQFISAEVPDAVILGGNISKSFQYFKNPLLLRLKIRFPEIVIKTALLGEEAALLGAASHWKNKDVSANYLKAHVLHNENS